jgi:hypothetical protein
MGGENAAAFGDRPCVPPGQFCLRLGHAIAWKSAIDSVCFQAFASGKFSVFFEELLTVLRVTFSDYQSKRIPPLGA